MDSTASSYFIRLSVGTRLISNKIGKDQGLGTRFVGTLAGRPSVSAHIHVYYIRPSLLW